jgi:hypothetical protein
MAVDHATRLAGRNRQPYYVAQDERTGVERWFVGTHKEYLRAKVLPAKAVIKPKPLVEVDFDEATYIGNEEDGVYFAVGEVKGKGWFLSAVVDCNSAGFTETLVTDDGPYPTREEAEMGGRNAAYEWCSTNEIAIDYETEGS